MISQETGHSQAHLDFSRKSLSREGLLFVRVVATNSHRRDRHLNQDVRLAGSPVQLRPCSRRYR